MTTWSANNVAHFARAAGFDGQALVDATALALAATRGDDAWHYVAGFNRATDQRGLWALDVARVPFIAGLDLWSPATSADALRRLYQANLATLAWHPVFESPAFLRALPAAESAVRQRYEPDRLRELSSDAAAIAAERAAALVGRQARRTVTDVVGALRRLY